ncbi:hypothetical protein V6N13_117403 [Hibiscus sabdariffa]|uniref:Uncharacterized protein n=1 Tax=Hibiscus sabdariffa TaxID=183260 RepID=A0ABR2PB65_9ROSI
MSIGGSMVVFNSLEMGMYKFCNELLRNLALYGAVEEVDSEAEGFVDKGDNVTFRNGTKDGAKRGSSETHASKLHAMFPRALSSSFRSAMTTD